MVKELRVASISRQRKCSAATSRSVSYTHLWDGDEGVRDHLFELARILDEQCTSQYKFMLDSARAKAGGEPLADWRKESAKTDMILKEASRRRLAGIPTDVKN